MPDKNKYQKLRDVGYQIPPTCGFCNHGRFASPANAWGECQKHRYEHLKHDNPKGGRGISILRFGTCPDVKVEPEALLFLGAHHEFFQKK